MERKKEIFIEILRLLACILVILYHSRYQIYEFISGGGEKSVFWAIIALMLVSS